MNGKKAVTCNQGNGNTGREDKGMRGSWAGKNRNPGRMEWSGVDRYQVGVQALGGGCDRIRLLSDMSCGPTGMRFGSVWFLLAVVQMHIYTWTRML